MQSTAARSQPGILLHSGTNEVEFIEFFLGSDSYGVNVSKVQRVMALSTCKITALAGAPNGVLGVIQVLDKPVLLVDLRTALALPAAEGAAHDRQLVMVTRFNQRTTAFLIDGVSKIHRTSWADFEPMTGSLARDGAGYTSGTIRIGDRIILILDLERLMIDYRPTEYTNSATPPSPDAETRRKRESINIVYAEDSKLIRKFTLDVLHKAGFAKITCFENGQEAHDHLAGLAATAAAAGRPLRELVDLVITDIEMPKLDGLTLCKAVKASDPHPPPVIVYSSLISDEMARKCLSVGADAQLSKPNGAEIVAIVDRLCGCGAAS